MKYFNLWGLLTFYLYKDNAILFMNRFVASLFVFSFCGDGMGRQGKQMEIVGSYCTLEIMER